MSKIPHVSKEKNALSKNQFLIIDKVGIIGQALCEKLAGKPKIVFVSKKIPDFKGEVYDIVYVAYGKKIPILPDDIYSHILLVADQTTSSKEILEPLIRKAKEDSSIFIFITYLGKVDRELIISITDSYKKSMVFIYGDIFGKTAIKDIGDFKSIANNFIYQATTKGKIKVAGNGLSKTYPVFMDDLVLKILDNIFNSNSTSRIFKIFPRHYQTQLSLAHMLQKPNPTINIDFADNSERNEYERPEVFSEGEYLLEDRYSLGSKFREVNLDNKIGKEELEGKNFGSKKKQKFRSLFFKFLFFLVVFLLLPFISTLSFFLLGLKGIDDVRAAIDKGNIQLAEKEAQNSSAFFNFTNKSSDILIFEAKLLGLDKSLEGFLKTVDFGRKMSSSISDSLEGVKSLLGVFNKKSSNPREDFDKARILIKNSIVLFKQAETGENASFDINRQLKSLDSLTTLASNTIDVWPELFGFNGKRIYLVLFQNNMELRPTGGFIGSYGVLAVENGKILDFSIHDTYDADGHLLGHVEPPYPLRRFLPTAHFYLRDSNFDLDFTRSASNSAFLFSQETGTMVDGVIGIDLSFVKNLIGALDNVYVSDYKETVNKDNLFLLAESHVEKNFFPGSTQKKDFLRSLFSAMQANFQNKKGLSYVSLAKAINDSLSQKHLLFAFANQSVQDIFTINNWSSSLWEGREESDSKINDFLGINEANLGVNKANYFIKRKISENISINTDGVIEGKLTISYFNESVLNKWPGGDYKNYLRIILPESKLLDILIDGQEQKIVPAITDPGIYEKKDFLPPEGLEIETTKEEGKTIYGFLVNIPSGKLKQITIKYSLSQKLTLNQQSFSYNLRVFKQPGTDTYPFEFSLNYPPSYNTVLFSQGLNKKDNLVFLSKDLLTDEEIFVNLAVK